MRKAMLTFNMWSSLQAWGSYRRNVLPTKWASLDKVFAPGHNVLSLKGFRFWLSVLLSTSKGALVWLGTQCSSLDRLCASQSCRTDENSFMGDTDRLFVKKGDMLAEISALMFVIAHALQNCVVLEQPANSCLGKYGAMKSAIGLHAYHVKTFGACFGQECLKPLQLCANVPELVLLERSKPDFACESLETGIDGGFTQPTSNKLTNNKQQPTNNKKHTPTNKQPTTNNKQQTPNNEQQTTNNKKKHTNNKQQTANSQQQTRNNKRQTKNNNQ